jgi:hypothetical protein
MSQFEQENDLGRGGGEVDDETMKEAWKNAEERRSHFGTDRSPAPDPELEDDDAPDAA